MLAQRILKQHSAIISGNTEYLRQIVADCDGVMDLPHQQKAPDVHEAFIACLKSIAAGGTGNIQQLEQGAGLLRWLAHDARRLARGDVGAADALCEQELPELRDLGRDVNTLIGLIRPGTGMGRGRSVS